MITIKDFKTGQSAFIVNMNLGRKADPSITETMVAGIGRVYVTTTTGRRFMEGTHEEFLTEKYTLQQLRTVKNILEPEKSDDSAVILPEGSAILWRKIAWATLTDLPDILKQYPQLVAACTVETEYQSEERAKMDGYEKVFESDGHILYAKETDKHKCTYAEVIC